MASLSAADQRQAALGAGVGPGPASHLRPEAVLPGEQVDAGRGSIDDRLPLTPVGDVERVRRDLTALRLRLDGSQRALAALHEDLTAQADAATLATARADAAEAKVQELERMVGALSGGTNASDLRRLRGDLCEMANTQIAALREELVARDREAVALRSTRHGRLAADAAVRAEVERLHHELAHAHVVAEGLGRDAEGAREEARALEGTVSRLSAEATTLEHHRKVLEASGHALTHKVASETALSHALETSLADADGDVQRLAHQVGALREALRIERATSSSLRDEVTEALHGGHGRQATLQQYEAQMKAVSKRHADAEAQLRHRAEAAEREAQRLRAELQRPARPALATNGAMRDASTLAEAAPTRGVECQTSEGEVEARAAPGPLAGYLRAHEERTGAEFAQPPLGATHPSTADASTQSVVVVPPSDLGEDRERCGALERKVAGLEAALAATRQEALQSSVDKDQAHEALEHTRRAAANALAEQKANLELEWQVRLLDVKHGVIAHERALRQEALRWRQRAMANESLGARAHAPSGSVSVQTDEVESSTLRGPPTTADTAVGSAVSEGREAASWRGHTRHLIDTTGDSTAESAVDAMSDRDAAPQRVGSPTVGPPAKGVYEGGERREIRPGLPAERGHASMPTSPSLEAVPPVLAMPTGTGHATADNDKSQHEATPTTDVACQTTGGPSSPPQDTIHLDGMVATKAVLAELYEADAAIGRADARLLDTAGEVAAATRRSELLETELVASRRAAIAVGGADLESRLRALELGAEHLVPLIEAVDAAATEAIASQAAAMSQAARLEALREANAEATAVIAEARADWAAVLKSHTASVETRLAEDALRGMRAAVAAAEERARRAQTQAEESWAVERANLERQRLVERGLAEAAALAAAGRHGVEVELLVAEVAFAEAVLMAEARLPGPRQCRAGEASGSREGPCTGDAGRHGSDPGHDPPATAPRAGAPTPGVPSAQATGTGTLLREVEHLFAQARQRPALDRGDFSGASREPGTAEEPGHNHDRDAAMAFRLFSEAASAEAADPLLELLPPPPRAGAPFTPSVAASGPKPGSGSHRDFLSPTSSVKSAEPTAVAGRQRTPGARPRLGRAAASPARAMLEELERVADSGKRRPGDRSSAGEAMAATTSGGRAGAVAPQVEAIDNEDKEGRSGPASGHDGAGAGRVLGLRALKPEAMSPGEVRALSSLLERALARSEGGAASSAARG